LVVGRNRERGEKAVAEIRASGGKADFISSELRDASSAREVAQKALELGGGHVDILINNAGIFPFGPTDKTTEEEFDKVYSLDVKAPYFLVAELAPLMAKRGVETRGLVKMLIDAQSDRILGFAALGVEGSEMMAAVQTAMLGGLPYTVLRDAIFTHPTTAEGLVYLLANVTPKAMQRPA
jgi:NAD(P)-dependent dehydrogenase (short-subunit alcohol dehydrogenase family)